MRLDPRRLHVMDQHAQAGHGQGHHLLQASPHEIVIVCRLQAGLQQGGGLHHGPADVDGGVAAGFGDRQHVVAGTLVEGRILQGRAQNKGGGGGGGDLAGALGAVMLLLRQQVGGPSGDEAVQQMAGGVAQDRGHDVQRGRRHGRAVGGVDPVGGARRDRKHDLPALVQRQLGRNVVAQPFEQIGQKRVDRHLVRVVGVGRRVHGALAAAPPQLLAEQEGGVFLDGLEDVRDRHALQPRVGMGLGERAGEIVGTGHRGLVGRGNPIHPMASGRPAQRQLL